MSLNRAMVIGNLGGDPELKYLPSGQPVVGFSIATDEAYTDKQGQKQERVEWHNIVVFGKAISLHLTPSVSRANITACRR